MTDVPREVRIHYRRPPDREDLFHQTLLLDTDEVKVTLAREMTFEEPIRIGGEVALESGSDVVWFTFPGQWHDIGRFHRADDTFTGIYANVLTPPTFHPGDAWYTTDLFLDVWLPAGGKPLGGEGDPTGGGDAGTGGAEAGAARILDEEQLAEAVERGWVDPETARRARREAARLVDAVETGTWPPPVVEAWDLTRARGAAQSSSSSSSSTR